MSKAPVKPKATTVVPLEQAEIEAILTGEHGDPFAVLGVQGEGAKLIARAFIPDAERVEAFTLTDKTAGVLELRHAAGFSRARSRSASASR